MRFERRRGALFVVGGPVPRGSSAITFGPVVLIRRGSETSPYLIEHELVHVAQWRERGVLAFSARYLGAYAVWRLRRKGHRGAYVRIPFEVEADWLARRKLGAGVLRERSRSPLG
jgi:hypothetical protein